MDELELSIGLTRRLFELDVTLSVGGGVLAIIGPSGGGKSSLLRAVAGLERPQRGRITLAGTTWFDADRRIDLAPERRRVGYVPQDYALFPHMNVAANVRFGGRGDQTQLLENLGIAHLARARPRSLSGGERQRVALARALARRPRVLLLDEPFGALDPSTRGQVRDELAAHLREVALPTLLVTHAVEDATVLAERVAVIDHGRLVQLSDPPTLLARPASVEVARLVGANCIEAEATPVAGGSILQLDGGGTLTSSERARGRVTLAIHPWELTLGDPHSESVVDQVLRLGPSHGGTRVILSRFNVQLPPGHPLATSLRPGETVGVRVDLDSFRVLPTPASAQPGHVGVTLNPSESGFEE